MTTRLTVTNGSVDLAVVVEGNPDGETLVLVHGWPDTHGMWGGVVERLGDRFRIVRFDNRGAGESSAPKGVEWYSLGHLAADLFAVIEAVSPDAPVHVLAHDWGSVAVWEAVCEPGAPERIASFTSVSGPNLDYLSTWARASLSQGRLAGPLAQVAASAYTVAFQIPGLAAPVLRGLSRVWPRFLRFFDGLDPATVHVAPTLYEDMVRGLALYRANIRERLARPRRRTTTVPVQLVVNSRDHAVRPVSYEMYEQWAPIARRVTISSGHWAPFSHPGDLARAVADFVPSLAAGAATHTETAASASQPG
ncbi:alpha/beta fold hydrolase [Rhodococcus rhodnii]|uniref:Epoxide hydratase n=2 Tax=Rhodococcus rhodnii TaxID=38312 RepID=R7WNX3_9NOCA|nr:alpha/beta fold hydrolase [Rhodococcus rhodnii]EOM75689.1 epoxide hydratase [Rhodococcus rhodnii LMG 5362]TXG89666.1 alpha/beta fold hydrolase [Rhodococcus rhodnii]